MIYKSKEFKRNNFNKLIFNSVIFLYFLGLCVGCMFAVKNTDNWDYVKRITDIEKLTFKSNTPFFKVYRQQILHSISFIALALIFKYSGILKSMTVVIPFVLAIQNSCVYTVLLVDGEFSIYRLLFEHTLKNTAISFVIILYVYIMIKEILSGREHIKKDIKKLLIYCTTIFFVYLIDYLIKTIIYPR